MFRQDACGEASTRQVSSVFRTFTLSSLDDFPSGVAFGKQCSTNFVPRSLHFIVALGYNARRVCRRSTTTAAVFELSLPSHRAKAAPFRCRRKDRCALSRNLSTALHVWGFASETIPKPSFGAGGLEVLPRAQKGEMEDEIVPGGGDRCIHCGVLHRDKLKLRCSFDLRYSRHRTRRQRFKEVPSAPGPAPIQKSDYVIGPQDKLDVTCSRSRT